MALLYGRKIIVDVAGLTIEDLRINVQLSRDIDNTQDKGHVNIYNLSQKNEELIYARGDSISIQAGYPSTLAVMFEGSVQRIIRIREDLARIIQIHVGDKVHDPDTLGGSYSVSFDGAVSSRVIAQDIVAKGMGLTLGPLDAIPADATFDNFYWGGYSASAALDALLIPLDLNWFNDNGVIRINKNLSAQTDASTITVSKENGLIDSPVVTDEGVEIKTFFNPRSFLGSIIDLRSSTVSGIYKIVAINHRLDNWESSSFETNLDLREL